MLKRIENIIAFLENAPLTLGSFVATFSGIVVIRLILEHFFLRFPYYSTNHYFYHFTHEYLSFLATFILSLLVVRFAGGESIKKSASFLLYGFLILWSVPITEAIISHGAGFWSFYTFDSLPGLVHRYFTFFGDKPYVGTTYGVRIEIAVAVLLVTFYTFVKSRKIVKTVLVAIILYTLLFSLGSFPSIVTILLEGGTKGFLGVTEADVASLMLSPTALFGFTPSDLLSVLSIKMSLVFATVDIFLIASLLFFFFRPYFWALFKNARMPQLIYHGGLFLLGVVFAFPYAHAGITPNFFHSIGILLLIAAVECSWLASVVVNDIHDTKIDAITNAFRPLPTGSIPTPLYQTIGFLFFGGAILLATLVSTQVAFLLIGYQALAWLYSAWPLRLKRFPIVATLLAAAASLLVFFAGYIVLSPEKSLAGLPWQIPLFLFVAYALLLPIKDFKDTDGDRADGVFTLPVLLGEVWAKRLIGGALLLLFVSSIFLLRLPNLFWLAFFFGSLAYWMLQISEKNHRTLNYRSLAGWYVALAFFYGLFLFLTLLGN